LSDFVESNDILLVEDNPADIRLISDVIESTNVPFNLMVINDGERAIELLKHKIKSNEDQMPKLVILDLNLPKKSGKEVLKVIKEDHDLKIIPVIILTTSPFREDIIETYQNHVNAFITKPVDLKQFIQIIESTVNFWLKSVETPQ
jgi:CheY-like chemotaxis protein